MVEGIKIHTVDTRKTVMPLYSMAKHAYELVQQGESAEDIVQYIESMKNEYKIYLAVGDLTLLQKNGRLSTASAMIGSILKIKPLLMVDDEGVIKSVEKIRTMKKALRTMADAFIEEGEVSEVNILHSNCPELAEDFKALLAEIKPDYKEIPVFQLSPVIGSHLGTGTVGITFRRGSN
jgi:DegV family protein with EDD domain